jgi:hypothetical protein
MPLYFGRAKSKVGSGYDGSEGSVIIQEEEEIPGVLNPGSHVFPIFKKVFHSLLPQGESNFYLITNYI